MASEAGGLDTEPAWWPIGADENLVRECNCEYCKELSDALDEWRQGEHPDGEHAALNAFGERGEEQ